MRTVLLLFVSVFIGFLCTGCGPTPAEKRSQQVALAKDDALKLREQLAQAKSGPEAEKLLEQLTKRLSDAGLTVDSIHFTEAELNNYVKVASAAAAPAPVATEAKAARQSKGRRAGRPKKRAR